MRQSQIFTKTIKETPKGATFISHQLLLRGGFIYQFASGIYGLLPLGLRVFQRIENIIREEFEKIGIQELLMPLLHPAELWKKTGRWETTGKELWKIKSRKGEEMVLAMTHEETVAAIAANTIRSEAELPVIVNQFQIKVRDEERPRGGLLRLREFIMQDAYSFDRDEKDLDVSFQKMIEVYKKIFKKINLPVMLVKASAGLMGGSDSYEFMVVAESGEDRIAVCAKCNFAANVEILKNKEKCSQCGMEMKIKKSIEVAHTFKLGTKYSKAMNIVCENKKGEKQFVQMGCYGIGLERAIATIVEICHDEKGIIWPKEIAPFDVHLIPIENNQKIYNAAEILYEKLSSKNSDSSGGNGNGQKQGIEVLYDDRKEKTAGEKFADADLIGIPTRIVVSERTLAKDSVEIKQRNEKNSELIKIEDINLLFLIGQKYK